MNSGSHIIVNKIVMLTLRTIKNKVTVVKNDKVNDGEVRHFLGDSVQAEAWRMFRMFRSNHAASSERTLCVEGMAYAKLLR